MSAEPDPDTLLDERLRRMYEAERRRHPSHRDPDHPGTYAEWLEERNTRRKLDYEHR